MFKYCIHKNFHRPFRSENILKTFSFYVYKQTDTGEGWEICQDHPEEKRNEMHQLQAQSNVPRLPCLFLCKDKSQFPNILSFILYLCACNCFSHQVVSYSCNLMDCSPNASSVHGILQARILEWVAISFSRVSSWPRKWTRVSCIAGRSFTDWATRECTVCEQKHGFTD